VREDRIIAGAFGVSLLLHLVLAAVTWRLPFIPEIDPAVAEAAETEVEVLLLDPEEEAAEAADQPRSYVAMPERLASETPPEQPDHLALHDSRAADRKQGDSDTPSADQEQDFPTVEVQREQLEGAGGVAYAPQALPDPRESVGSPREGAEGEDEEKQEADPRDERGEWALPRETEESGGETTGEEDDEETEEARELEDWWGGAQPSILREGEQAARGDRGFEFDQAARGSIGPGAIDIGEFTLNTVAWKWAPWMNRFANELHRHWNAPMAYRMGIISGVTTIRIMVEKDGRLSSLVVLQKDGHESLHDASQAALKAFAPYAPLPPDFPEENLVITLLLHYPAWRR
jgi:outer membrane biosynthesis protein TonB